MNLRRVNDSYRFIGVNQTTTPEIMKVINLQVPAVVQYTCVYSGGSYQKSVDATNPSGRHVGFKFQAKDKLYATYEIAEADWFVM